MAVATLDAMADGGIHDQLGGGFHRYAVDGRWLVPHFEKMLYDNALLARAYAIAGGGDRRGAVRDGRARRPRLPRPRDAARRRRRRARAGRRHRGRRGPDVRLDAGRGAAPCSATTRSRAPSATGTASPGPATSRAPTCSRRSVGTGTRRRPGSTRRAREAARRARDPPAAGPRRQGARRLERHGPAAFADAGRLLGEPRLRRARARHRRRSCSAPLSDDGRLRRTWRDGQAKITGFSEDYGAVADGLIALHRRNRRAGAGWTRRAGWRCSPSTCSATPAGRSADAARRRAAGRAPPDLDDNPAPSGNSLVAGALLALARVYGDAEWEDRAVEAVAPWRRSSTARRRRSATRSA